MLTNLGKARPVTRAVPPAGLHYAIVLSRAMHRLLKALAAWFVYRLQDLVAGECCPGLEPIAEQFPHGDAKRLMKRQVGDDESKESFITSYVKQQ